ncbi:peptide ABC transporter substrate-binding protein [Actinobacillus succinogenes]|uniref:4-phytase n=1 Tax=Actinobacillus succinogenes (strain ATCC 55618 / DSM 22257 / CCUG 43843 / 130Z) TaxID=339671 RepID=A6VND4_ACTSZ|nr:4-phytase [Actinobacillus succinogenes 130Z]PHI41100.1 peptide ABC transporter substrate-binding protein [Actinobacillus succinogenes]
MSHIQYFSMKRSSVWTVLCKSALRFLTVFFTACSLSACEPLSEFGRKLSGIEANRKNEIQPAFTPLARTQERLIRGVYGELTLDVPSMNNEEQADFLRDLLEGLVIFDSRGDILPGVAERWENQDDKLWRFYLRPQAKWSNGEPVVAQDFVDSWRKLALSDSPLKQSLMYINLLNAQAVTMQQLTPELLGVRAADERILEIELDKPTPYLPKMLTHAAFLPTRGNMPAEFLSNGAYRFIRMRGNRIFLDKNPVYWNEANVTFNSVVYEKMAEDQSPETIDWLESPKHASQAIYFPTLCTYFYRFNLQDPELSRRSVRTALVSMISSQYIVRNEHLPALPLSDFLPRHMQTEQNQDWQPSVVEPLLQQAGISAEKPLHITLTYDRGYPQENIANRLVRTWSQSELIHVTPQPVSFSVLLEKQAKGEFQLIRSGWCADYNDPSAFFNLLHGQHPDNKTGIDNAEINQWLEQSLTVKTEAERTALYQKIQHLVKQERYFLPLYQIQRAVYIHPSIRGFDLTNPTSTVYSKDLSRHSTLPNQR